MTENNTEYNPFEKMRLRSEDVTQLIEITRVKLPVLLNVVQEAGVPECLYEMDKPLGIHLDTERAMMSIWVWKKGTIKQARFLMIRDDEQFPLTGDKGQLRQHFGTVLDADGRAIHLLALSSAGGVAPLY